jgi:hypothetical protein
MKELLAFILFLSVWPGSTLTHIKIINDLVTPAQPAVTIETSFTLPDFSIPAGVKLYRSDILGKKPRRLLSSGRNAANNREGCILSTSREQALCGWEVEIAPNVFFPFTTMFDGVHLHSYGPTYAEDKEDKSSATSTFRMSKLEKAREEYKQSPFKKSADCEKLTEGRGMDFRNVKVQCVDQALLKKTTGYFMFWNCADEYSFGWYWKTTSRKNTTQICLRFPPSFGGEGDKVKKCEMYGVFGDDPRQANFLLPVHLGNTDDIAIKIHPDDTEVDPRREDNFTPFGSKPLRFALVFGAVLLICIIAGVGCYLRGKDTLAEDDEKPVEMTTEIMKTSVSKLEASLTKAS